MYDQPTVCDNDQLALPKTDVQLQPGSVLNANDGIVH